jgi:MFS family permease
MVLLLGTATGPVEVRPYLTFDLRCQHSCGQRTKQRYGRRMPGETVQEVVRHRAMITACTIGATVLQLLDQTIANVALPFMQGSFSASFDEISWVLTSYITASAIMTAPVGWLAARYGRKSLYVSSILGFTITSMLCGAAQSLGQIVVFRVLQGAFGAALAPLSQATLLDIYPPERRGCCFLDFGSMRPNASLAWRLGTLPARYNKAMG